MYHSTRGIVFRQTRYSDSSLVVRILTEELGLRSYIVKGARGPKARIKAALFQPLTLLDLVVSQKEKSDLHHIKEARLAYAYQTIPTDIRKASILLFLDELLLKSIQEESANPELFAYIYDHLLFLDQAPEAPGGFHLLFTIHLSQYLGFFPQGDYHDEHSVFDMEEGHFTRQGQLFGGQLISGENCRYFSELIRTAPEKADQLKLPQGRRQEMLELLLQYFQLHLPLQGAFKSHIVLHEVLQK